MDYVGIAVRAEAGHLDGFDPDPADLLTDGSMRRPRRTEEAEHEARQRRRRIDRARPSFPDETGRRLSAIW